jgi:uncharacterized protein (TIGR02145 family)
MKTTCLFFLIAQMFFFCAKLHAQVTIGGLENPKAGAILDLNSNTKGGLVLSNVTIEDPEKIPQNTNIFEGVSNVDVNLDLRGIIVYNDGQHPAVPAGIYIWNGNCWTKDGGNIVVTAPSITVNGTATDSYATVENGIVTFAVVSPQTDVNYVWYEAGSPSSPAGAGETYITPPLSAGTYHYCCRATSKSCPSANDAASGTIELIVFSNSTNPLTTGTGTFTGRTCFDVAKTEGDGRGTLAVRQDELLTATSALAEFTQTVTNTQTYTFTPSGTVSKLRFFALEPATYAGQIVQSQNYNPDLKTQLNISGAQTLTIVYKDGLNETAEGTNHFSALKVDIYAVYNNQWDGNGEDKIVKLTASIKDCSCCGAYTDAGHTHTPPGTSNEDWLMDADHNPCPAGWRVPAENEWTGVIESIGNDWTPIPATPGDWGIDPANYNTGVKIGDALFLPAAGFRNCGCGTGGVAPGRLEYRGNYGTYWSSTASGTNGLNMHFFYNLLYTGTYERHHGFSVRCVAN